MGREDLQPLVVQGDEGGEHVRRLLGALFLVEASRGLVAVVAVRNQERALNPGKDALELDRIVEAPETADDAVELGLQHRRADGCRGAPVVEHENRRWLHPRRPEKP